MNKNWYYYLIGAMFLSMLLVSVTFFKGSAHSSVGLAVAHEYWIKTEKPAIVKSIAVLSGQEVKKGTLLIELTSEVLEIEIDRLVSQIEVLKSQIVERNKVSKTEVDYIRAEHGVDIEEINAEIDLAESEFKLNRELTKEFAFSKDTIQSGINPLDVKMSALKKQKVSREKAIEIRTRDILQRKETDEQQILNQIGLLNRELDVLYNERKNLNKYASGDGVVGNIMVKEGEQVESFFPLLSLNPKSPSIVVGYQVGKKSPLPVGSEVEIKSYDQSNVTCNGKVIGYGSVIELPEILQKSTAVKSFGRQMFVEIGPENEFATGEKVLIR